MGEVGTAHVLINIAHAPRSSSDGNLSKGTRAIHEVQSN